MRHCVGSGRCQQDSDYGDCRIYHLQPKPARAKPDWKPDDIQARHHGSAVMLVNRSLPGQPVRWQPSQHRGHYNRPPTAAEQFAQRLAAALNNAEAMATAIRPANLVLQVIPTTATKYRGSLYKGQRHRHNQLPQPSA